MQPGLISILILTKNDGKYIEVCLRQILSQKISYPFEIVVVDSGSTDNTLSILHNFPVRIYQIPPREFRHGRTRQYGADRCQGEILVTIVSDAQPISQFWLSHLVEDFFLDPQVAGVFGRQIPREDCDPFRDYQLRHWITFEEGKKVVSIQNPQDFDKLSPWEKLKRCTFDDVNSARRMKLLEKYPFPDASYGEDLIWAKTILENGYKIVYRGDAPVIHSHKSGLRYWFKRSYLDQRLVAGLFGIKLYPDFHSVFRSLLSGTVAYWKIALNQNIKKRKNLKWLGYAPFLIICLVVGGFLGIISQEPENTLPRQFRPLLKIISLKIGERFDATPLKRSV
ncbi:MAG: glycosyltransferase family 2 protein [Proteobacteria bacterium]|nr:glycosyltransferase family 2 protein [Pseudomonadota bacterium]